MGTAISPALAQANNAAARSAPVGSAMTTRSPRSKPKRPQRQHPGVRGRVQLRPGP